MAQPCGPRLADITPLATELVAIWRASGVSYNRLEVSCGVPEGSLSGWVHALADGRPVMAKLANVPLFEDALERARVWTPEPWQVEGRRRNPAAAAAWHCDHCYRAGHPHSDHPYCEWCERLTGPAHEMHLLVWYVGWKMVYPYTHAEPTDDLLPWALWFEGYACEACAGLVPPMNTGPEPLQAYRCDAPVSLVTAGRRTLDRGDWDACEVGV